MRRTTAHPPTRRLLAAAPAAIVGSIALSLSAESAHAAPPAPRLSPGSVDKTSLSPLRAAVAAPAAVTAVTPPDDYTVQPGDTVTAIAARYGLDTVDVLTRNGMGWSTVIYPGQVIRLGPGAAAASSSAATPSSAATTHTVQAGDTVSAIAGAHGLSAQAVLAANGLSWSSIIYPGEELTIPGAAAETAMTSVAEDLSPAASTTATASVDDLDAEQVENARLIIRIGRELGVSDTGIAIALGTAMQESWIRNLDWGDRDSLGLFQQRPSTGWGSADQVRDRERSIRAFYGGASDPNGTATRGLLDIPGWESMGYAQAAQAVQVSAYPDRYARWEEPAHRWLAALG